MVEAKPRDREITNWGWFLWAWFKDAFGKAWWVVGLVTLILPLLSGFVREDRPSWEENPCFKWLHDHADFTIPFWGAVLVCVWRVLAAPYDLFKGQKRKADDASAKLAAIENAKPILKVELLPRPIGTHPQLLRTIFSIRVTNDSSSVAAEHVSAALLSLERLGKDQGPIKTGEINPAKFPHSLMRDSDDYKWPGGYDSLLNPKSAVTFDVFGILTLPYAFYVGFSPFKQPEHSNKPWESDWSFKARETTTQPERQEYRIVIQITSKTTVLDPIPILIVIPGANEHGLPDWSKA